MLLRESKLIFSRPIVLCETIEGSLSISLGHTVK